MLVSITCFVLLPVMLGRSGSAAFCCPDKVGKELLHDGDGTAGGATNRS